MDKIRSNLFSSLQKTAGGINFRRIIHVGLITVIFILVGCSSKPSPSATVTATPEATAIPKATLKPSPTAVEITATPVEGAVVTDQGSVFVENGKYMVIDKRGIKKEIKDISTEVTFSTMKDASDIVLAMHVEEFANQNRADYFPGNLENDALYLRIVDKAVLTGVLDLGEVAPVAGIPVEFTTTKSNSVTYPKIATMMLKVYGDPRPIPLVMGVFDSAGQFHSFFRKAALYSPDKYPHTDQVTQIASSDWNEVKRIVGRNIIRANLYYALGPDDGMTFVDSKGAYNTESLSLEIVAERNRLLQANAKQALFGYKVIESLGFTLYQTGDAYAQQEQLFNQAGGTGVYYLDASSNIQVIFSY